MGATRGDQHIPAAGGSCKLEHISCRSVNICVGRYTVSLTEYRPGVVSESRNVLTIKDIAATVALY